jgi:hypothetical protein
MLNIRIDADWPCGFARFTSARKRLLATALLMLSLGAIQAQEGNSIDLSRVRQLYERRQRGETLTGEEKAYLERAIAQRRKELPRPASRRRAPDRLIPLSDLSADERYEGEDGGLYGRGLNTPPLAHGQLAQAELARIRPLDGEGSPDDHGLIGFVSISMSNATQEFSRFKQIADASPLKSPKVVIIDCAQGGQAWRNGRPEPGGLGRKRGAGCLAPRFLPGKWRLRGSSWPMWRPPVRSQNMDTSLSKTPWPCCKTPRLSSPISELSI